MHVDFILELYSFDYNQNDVIAKFKDVMSNVFSLEEFKFYYVIDRLEKSLINFDEAPRFFQDVYDIIEYNQFGIISGYFNYTYLLDEPEIYGDYAHMRDTIIAEGKTLLQQMKDFLVSTTEVSIERFEEQFKNEENEKAHTNSNKENREGEEDKSSTSRGNWFTRMGFSFSR